MKKVEDRESNIELLKIIAVFFIILSHTLPVYKELHLISFVDLTLTTKDFNTIIMIFFRALGQIGNVIFIACSAYFLVDSKKIKISKIIKMILNATIISMLLFFLFVIGFEKNWNYRLLISSMFPTIYTNNYWFICCYILLYSIHPIMNLIIENITKRKLLLINLCLITLYSIINMMYEITFFYNELIGAIEIYFIVAYMKRYMPKFENSNKINFLILFLSVVLFISSILVTNFWGFKYDYYENKNFYWIIISNPFIILIAISLLNLFKKIHIKSVFINYWSSLSLLVYLISENHFVREIIRMEFFDCYYGQKNVLLLVFIDFIRTVWLSFLFALLYNFTISIIIDKISNKLSNKAYKYGSKILDKLEKIN